MDAAQLLKSGAVTLNPLTGRFQKYDPNDASFSSDRHKQQKMERLDLEFSRIMERNNG